MFLDVLTNSLTNSVSEIATSSFKEVALTSAMSAAQKTAISFGVRCGTAVGSALGSYAVTRAISKKEIPLNEIPEEDRNKVTIQRIIRNSLIGAAFSTAGATVFTLANNKLEDYVDNETVGSEEEPAAFV